MLSCVNVGMVMLVGSFDEGTGRMTTPRVVDLKVNEKGQYLTFQPIVGVNDDIGIVIKTWIFSFQPVSALTEAYVHSTTGIILSGPKGGGGGNGGVRRMK
jgi:hypothetical protein